MEIAGESSKLRALLKHVSSLGRLGLDSPAVLITGETGVGKGLIARALHEERFGEAAPFIEVSCVAIPATLIEAELFGYEKSAFTDAKQSKPGLFEAASQGTLFLDEIGELSVELQAKLLTVVESRRVRRLGGVQESEVQCAIVCVANVDLRASVGKYGFRSYLYHRLASHLISVPPLRERADDAVLLASKFIRRAAPRYGKQLSTLSAEAEVLIKSASWPGNVRELIYAIDRAVLAAGDEETELTDEHLRTAGVEADGAAPAAADVAPGGARSVARLVVRSAREIEVEIPPQGVSFESIERAVLVSALERTGGNVVRAAKLLGLKRDAMRYRSRKLGIANLPL